MNPDVQWFFHLCVEKQILSEDTVHTIIRQQGSDLNFQDLVEGLNAYSPKASDDDLQDVVDEAWDHASDGDAPPELAWLSAGEKGLDAASKLAHFPDFPDELFPAEEGAQAFFKELIAVCEQEGASDLHLAAGAVPMVRLHRKLYPVSDQPLSADWARQINTCLLSEKERKEFAETKDLDFPLQLSESRRYRSNLFEHKEGVSGVYHLLGDKRRKLDELGFSNVETIRRMLSYHNGLILVTGPIGAGKTTTLAAMVEELNTTRSDHIITIEDPIEVIQRSDQGIVTQRQIETHTKSYHTAVKAALREDPDIIVFGELNDLQTIEMAITAAETGHLVIGTMHTSDVGSTLNRLVDAFPPVQQPQIRAMTSLSLRGVICQRLLTTVNDNLVLASEVLVNTTAVANIIREGKETGLKSAMQTGVQKGMVLMDNSVMKLFREGRISGEVARKNMKALQSSGGGGLL